MIGGITVKTRNITYLQMERWQIAKAAGEWWYLLDSEQKNRLLGVMHDFMLENTDADVLLVKTGLCGTVTAFIQAASSLLVEGKNSLTFKDVIGRMNDETKPVAKCTLTVYDKFLALVDDRFSLNEIMSIIPNAAYCLFDHLYVWSLTNGIRGNYMHWLYSVQLGEDHCLRGGNGMIGNDTDYSDEVLVTFRRFASDQNGILRRLVARNAGTYWYLLNSGQKSELVIFAGNYYCGYDKMHIKTITTSVEYFVRSAAVILLWNTVLTELSLISEILQSDHDRDITVSLTGEEKYYQLLTDGFVPSEICEIMGTEIAGPITQKWLKKAGQEAGWLICHASARLDDGRDTSSVLAADFKATMLTEDTGDEQNDLIGLAFDEYEKEKKDGERSKITKIKMAILLFSQGRCCEHVTALTGLDAELVMSIYLKGKDLS